MHLHSLQASLTAEPWNSKPLRVQEREKLEKQRREEAQYRGYYMSRESDFISSYEATIFSELPSKTMLASIKARLTLLAEDESVQEEEYQYQTLFPGVWAGLKTDVQKFVNHSNKSLVYDNIPDEIVTEVYSAVNRSVPA